jgi:oligoribonuclease NrnB/cAMP/cGMP phosphodiesterase (DHH superfamily)
MKCFYHGDLDGKCAAAILYHSKVLTCTPEMFSMHYKNTLNLQNIQPHEEIWIVDFSFKPDVMEELLKITQNIVWIDHHKTSMEYKYSVELKGIRDNNFSGCELTWKYLYPAVPMPTIVKMLGRYDVWDFSKFGTNLNALQAGIQLQENNPESKNWGLWFGEGVLDHGGVLVPRSETPRLYHLLTEGGIALKYRDNQYSYFIKSYSFFAEFEGYKAICCNAGGASSQLFDSVTEDYDLMIPFVFDGEQWTVSLYTKKDIDCSELAKKYGGGGHKKASGFVCRELPLKNKKFT